MCPSGSQFLMLGGELSRIPWKAERLHLQANTSVAWLWKRKLTDTDRMVLAGCCLAWSHQSNPQSTSMGKGMAAIHPDRRERDHRKAPKAWMGPKGPDLGAAALVHGDPTLSRSRVGPSAMQLLLLHLLYSGSYKDTSLGRPWIISVVFSRKHNFCKAFVKTNMLGLNHSGTLPTNTT